MRSLPVSTVSPETLERENQTVTGPDYSSQQSAAPATMQMLETGDVDRKNRLILSSIEQDLNIFSSKQSNLILSFYACLLHSGYYLFKLHP